jgi:hypothetical protein
MAKDAFDLNANKRPNVLAQFAATSRFKQRIYRTSFHQHAIFMTKNQRPSMEAHVPENLSTLRP